MNPLKYAAIVDILAAIVRVRFWHTDDFSTQAMTLLGLLVATPNLDRSELEFFAECAMQYLRSVGITPLYAA